MENWDLFSDDDEEIVEYIDGADFFHREVQERQHHFTTKSEKAIHRRFRLQKRVVLILLDKIKRRLDHHHNNNRNEMVSPLNQLLCTLRFYATGSQLITCGDFIGVHESTACRIVHKVTDAIARLYPEFIKMPLTQEDQRRVAGAFYQIARFPRVIGAIDYTLVRMKSPGGDQAEIYRNRKGYFSINVQAICTADMKFSDVVARWHGSAHDSNIWDNSNQKRNFLQGVYGDFLLVGDSGYAQTPYMMTPLATVNQENQSLYNESQIRTRNVIERTFGVWKRRFPILSRGLQVHLRRISGIIIATCVLHNLAQQNGDPEPPLDPEYPPLVDNTDPSQSLNSSTSLITPGSRAQQVLIEQHFSQIKRCPPAAR